MALPKLSTTIARAFIAIDRLERLKSDSETLEAKYQHFISEMLMMRLFGIFEDTVAEMAFKILSGATYVDGQVPVLMHPRSTMSNARDVYLNFGRNKPSKNLKWTKASFINDSVRYVMHSNEPFIINAQNHGVTIDQMRRARNMIGHISRSSQTEFKELIRQVYSANIKLSIGAYLCSTKRHHVPNLVRHFVEVKTILKAMAKA